MNNEMGGLSGSKNAWPAEWLREQLIVLNQNALRDSPHDHLRGRRDYPNQSPEELAEEISAAERVGIKPVAPEEIGFTELMHGGGRIHWAVLTDGTLRVTPAVVRTATGHVRISHAILSGGQAVLAAGEGRIGGLLTNTTGHFRNGEHVVAPVKQAFDRIGISFKM